MKAFWLNLLGIVGWHWVSQRLSGMTMDAEAAEKTSFVSVGLVYFV
jgi:hypothetical protein